MPARPRSHRANPHNRLAAINPVGRRLRVLRVCRSPCALRLRRLPDPACDVGLRQGFSRDEPGATDGGTARPAKQTRPVVDATRVDESEQHVLGRRRQVGERCVQEEERRPPVDRLRHVGRVRVYKVTQRLGEGLRPRWQRLHERVDGGMPLDPGQRGPFRARHRAYEGAASFFVLRRAARHRPGDHRLPVATTGVRTSWDVQCQIEAGNAR